MYSAARQPIFPVRRSELSGQTQLLLAELELPRGPVKGGPKGAAGRR
jgi:hypothetical protein